MGNCAGAEAPSPAGASADDLGGESAAQGGGGWAGASTAGEGSLLRWGASGSCWEMSCSRAAATAGLMSWFGWVSEAGGADGGGPGGEGGRGSEGGGAWGSPGCFLLDEVPSEEDKQDREHISNGQTLRCLTRPLCTNLHYIILMSCLPTHTNGPDIFTPVKFLLSPQEGDKKTSKYKCRITILRGKVDTKKGRIAVKL